MKHEVESYAIIALIAVVSVAIVHAIVKPMLPASIQAYIP